MTKRHFPKKIPRSYIEALGFLATGNKVEYARCIDCAHWAGRCDKNRTVTF